jgi:hypothetical protein
MTGDPMGVSLCGISVYEQSLGVESGAVQS